MNPIDLLELDEQGTAERYDIIVDFSRFRIGDRVYLVNLLQQTRRPQAGRALTLREAMTGFPTSDPTVGPLHGVPHRQFRQQRRRAGLRAQVHDPRQERGAGRAHAADPDRCQPVRTRVVEFGRSGDVTSRDPGTGQCTPDCPDTAPEFFPWTIRVNGEHAHSFNANRISLLTPKPGEIEHWTYINGGGGWDHPIHLHFEEGITMNRGGASFPATENLVRKDVWRLRPRAGSPSKSSSASTAAPM